MSVMVLDAGNSIIKAKIARREQSEIAFPHALKLLSANLSTCLVLVMKGVK
jgi:hypothetical protein